MARLNTRPEDGDAEHEALLPDHHTNGSATKSSTARAGSSLNRFINTRIDTNRADILLIISFFISGMVDAGAYNAYSCFTSMQVGLLLTFLCSSIHF